MLKGLSGTNYTLPAKEFAKGGEGTIYKLPTGGIIKIYHVYTISLQRKVSLLESKIRYMYEHPPSKDVLKHLAWPIDVIYDSGVFCGFLMNELSNYTELIRLHSYSEKKQPPISLCLTVAKNLCSIVNELHKAGYLIGDFNPKNIGYNKKGTICIYDTDSFQFTDKETGHIYRCCVNFSGYIAPEIMEETEALRRQYLRENKPVANLGVGDLPTGFTLNTDYFALAVHIFKLLMNGFGPYDSIPRGYRQRIQENVVRGSSSSTILPSSDDNVKNDRFCFNADLEPNNVAVPHCDEFPSYITDLFFKSFTHVSPTASRATPLEWIEALQKYQKEAVHCKNGHIYWNPNKRWFHSDKTINQCPYCIANQRFKEQNLKARQERNYSFTNPPSNNFYNKPKTQTSVPANKKQLHHQAQWINRRLFCTVYLGLVFLLMGVSVLTAPPGTYYYELILWEGYLGYGHQLSLIIIFLFVPIFLGIPYLADPDYDSEDIELHIFATVSGMIFWFAVVIIFGTNYLWELLCAIVVFLYPFVKSNTVG